MTFLPLSTNLYGSRNIHEKKPQYKSITHAVWQFNEAPKRLKRSCFQGVLARLFDRLGFA